MKPATDARLAAAAKGFTQIVSRGPNHLITRDPQTLKCSFDTQVTKSGRGWHKDDGTECDSAWVAGVAPWNYQVLKCDFNLFALSQFNQGQILKWLDPTSGQYGYARVEVTNDQTDGFNAASSGQVTNKDPIEFPACTGTPWGALDTYFISTQAAADGTGDTTVAYATLDAEKTIGVGDTASFAAGALAIQLNEEPAP